MHQIKTFKERLSSDKSTLQRKPTRTLQLNLGSLCNQACNHCHVDAGPKRSEIMERSTMEQILGLIKRNPEIEVVDLTGGAPELNPDFNFLVSELTQKGLTVIDRCNLTVLFEKGQEGLAVFLAKNRVQISASLPCYSKQNVDHQRGQGVFDKSIEGLRILNHLGYGQGYRQADSELILNLVFNPHSPSLPPPQDELEAKYKKELKELFGIEFNQLFTITNMPIKRYFSTLQNNDQLKTYMNLLTENYNHQAVENLMCRSLISVSWNGHLFDCDFNQMLEIPLGWKTKTIWNVDRLNELQDHEIAFADHCYGCTAGTGSSCGGSLI